MGFPRMGARAAANYARRTSGANRRRPTQSAGTRRNLATYSPPAAQHPVRQTHGTSPVAGPRQRIWPWVLFALILLAALTGHLD